MRLRLTVAPVFVAALLAGCGGSSEGESAGSGDPQADAKAAQAAVQRFVDRNDCSVATDRLLEESYGGSGDESREACKADPFEGLRADDYTVSSSEARGSRATVLLDADDGSIRRFTVVRKGDGWLVDNVTRKSPGQRVAFGKSLSYFDAYELNGEPLDVRLIITVLSLKPREAPRFTPTKAGHRWMAMRVRVRSESSGTLDIASSSFDAVTSDGSRYKGAGSPFQPTLGNDVSSIAPDDTLKGYVSFQVPKGRRITEVRYSAPASTTGPLVWKVEA